MSDGGMREWRRREDEREMRSTPHRLTGHPVRSNSNIRARSQGATRSVRSGDTHRAVGAHGAASALSGIASIAGRAGGAAFRAATIGAAGAASAAAAAGSAASAAIPTRRSATPSGTGTTGTTARTSTRRAGGSATRVRRASAGSFASRASAAVGDAVNRLPLPGLPAGFGVPGLASPASVGKRPLSARGRVKANVLRRDVHEPDYIVLVAVIALSAIGVLMVYSSSAIRSYMQQGDATDVVGGQLIWALAGVAAMIVATRVDYRRLRTISVPFMVFALILLVLVLLPTPLRVVVAGSSRFLKLGPLPQLHPAEIAKLAMVIYLAHWLAKRGSNVRSFTRGTIPFLVIVAPAVLLVMREPDLGTAAVIGLTGFTIFFVAGANLLHVALAGLGGGGVAALILTMMPERLARVEIFLNPWSDPKGLGFHTIQGLFALGLGGIIGSGLGESKQAGGLFLPNAYNDYIFAVIGEEFGLIGAALVVLLFVALAYRGIKIALSAPDTFGALLATGVTAWLCIQAFINMAVVVSLIPVTGITLPFMSQGGSSLIISFAAVGILLSISRETVERGTWNDASADRGRGHGRAHLPGSRRRPISSRTSGRA